MFYSMKARSKELKEYVVIRHPQKPTGNVWMGGLKFTNGIAVVEKNSKVHRLLGRNPVFRHRKEFTLDWLPKFGFRTQDVLVTFGKDIYYSYLNAVGLGTDLKPLPKPEEEADESMADQTLEEVEDSKSEESTESTMDSHTSDETTQVVGYEPEDVEEIKEELAKEIDDPEYPEEEGVSEELAEMQLEAVEQNAEEEEEALPELSTEEVIEAHKEMGLCVHVKDDGEVCKNRVSKGSPSGQYCFGHIKKDPAFIKEES